MRDVIAELERAGAVVTVRNALCEDSGQDIASKAAHTRRYDVVVAAGGDGTIRSVAAGLRGTATPVGILPLGTGNVMAHELGVARASSEIGRYLLRGMAVPVVATLANGKPFFLMAGGRPRRRSGGQSGHARETLDRQAGLCVAGRTSDFPGVAHDPRGTRR